MIVLNDTAHGRDIANAAGFSDSKVIYVVSRECAAGKLLGGVIFSDYTGRGGSVHMHVAGLRPGWLSRQFLFTIFDYSFRHLGVCKVIGLVNESNKRTLLFDKKIGFIIEAIIPGVYPDGALCLMTMTIEQCRWLKFKEGNPRGETASASAP